MNEKQVELVKQLTVLTGLTRTPIMRWLSGKEVATRTQKSLTLALDAVPLELAMVRSSFFAPDYVPKESSSKGSSNYAETIIRMTPTTDLLASLEKPVRPSTKRQQNCIYAKMIAVGRKPDMTKIVKLAHQEASDLIEELKVIEQTRR